MSILKRIYCRNCKKKRELSVMNLYCSETCKVAFFELTIRKAAEKRDKKNKAAIEWQKKANENWKKFKVEQKTENRSYQAEIGLTKKPFQLWIRLRDKHHGINSCISCGKEFYKDEKIDGGHFKKAEVFSKTIFNPHNCWSQCISCNQHNHGSENAYRKGLEKRIGFEAMVKLEAMAESDREFRYDRPWLKMFRAKVNLLIKSNNFDNSNLFEMLREIDLY
jgi:hypothetical protein